MTENKPIGATLELVYVPDTYTETERQEGASWPLGSGYYDLVVLAGDARFTLHRFKAGAIDKAFALAKSRRDERATQRPATPTPSPQQPQQVTASTGGRTQTVRTTPGQQLPSDPALSAEQQQQTPPLDQQQQQRA